jgi:hypothetical protein
LCLLQDAQASIGKGGLEGLAAETRTYSVEGFAERKILTLGGRHKNYLRVAYSGRTKYSACASKLSKLSGEYLCPQKTQKAAVFFIRKIFGWRVN